MYKRGILVFFVWIFAVFLVGSVYAANEVDSTIIEQDVDVAKAYEWLYGQVNESWDSLSASDTALSILALRGKYDVEDGVDRLKSLESGDNWGDIKSSSLAVLALYKSGEEVEDEIAWLVGEQKKARTDGNWFIQLATNHGGRCTLNYEGGEHEFFVDGSNNEISSDSCETSNWIDFESCIKGGEAEINESIDVNCIISVNPSIIYNLGSNYYIVDETAPLNIENGCFGDSGDCECLTSGYASWALKEVESDSLVRPYMKSSCSEDPIYNSFLYILTREQQYVDWLKEKQQPSDGGWEGNLKTTYLSLLGLKKVGKQSGGYINDAINFINYFQKKTDWSWGSNIEDTAFILYILHSKDTSRPVFNGGGSECDNGILEEPEEECEFDYHCNVNGTTGDVCLGCECIPSGTNATASCDNDGTCDFGETTINCPLDCPPGTDPEPVICPPGEELDPVDGECKKPMSWLKWLFIILAILLGVALIYFVYMKFFKKKGGKGKSPLGGGLGGSPFKMTKQNVPRRKVPVQTYSRRESKMESELDASLKKARELLKK